MQAIILAAGMGRRLGEFTQNNTKCMVEVNGVCLIDRLLTQLSTLSLQRVVIVTGYKGENLQRYVGNEYKGLPIEYVNNPVYDKTNNIYSLSLAREQLQAGCIRQIRAIMGAGDQSGRGFLDDTQSVAAQCKNCLFIDSALPLSSRIRRQFLYEQYYDEHLSAAIPYQAMGNG